MLSLAALMSSREVVHRPKATTCAYELRQPQLLALTVVHLSATAHDDAGSPRQACTVRGSRDDDRGLLCWVRGAAVPCQRPVPCWWGCSATDQQARRALHGQIPHGRQCPLAWRRGRRGLQVRRRLQQLAISLLLFSIRPTKFSQSFKARVSQLSAGMPYIRTLGRIRQP